MPSDTANDPVQDGHVTVSVGCSAAFSVDCVLLLAVKQQIPLNVEEEEEEEERVVKPDTLQWPLSV